jgi:ketosteroid isomerase-like protein
MRVQRLSITALLLGLTSMAAWSEAPKGSPEQLVARHLAASAKGDVEGIVADYADDAVSISPGGVTHGKEELRKLFTGIFGGPPGSHPPLVLQQQVYTKEIGYITWTQNAGTPQEVHGSDTFVVRKGKIVAQTVAIVALHPPGK